MCQSVNVFLWPWLAVAMSVTIGPELGRRPAPCTWNCGVFSLWKMKILILWFHLGWHMRCTPGGNNCPSSWLHLKTFTTSSQKLLIKTLMQSWRCLSLSAAGQVLPYLYHQDNLDHQSIIIFNLGHCEFWSSSASFCVFRQAGPGLSCWHRNVVHLNLLQTRLTAFCCIWKGFVILSCLGVCATECNQSDHRN